MYDKEIMDIFLNSPFSGDLKGFDVSTQQKDKNTGDVIKLYFKINELQVVEEVKFKSFGGVMVTYASHMISLLSKGKTLFELNTLTAETFSKFATHLTSDYLYLSELSVKIVSENIKKYTKKHNIDLSDKTVIENKLEKVILKVNNLK